MTRPATEPVLRSAKRSRSIQIMVLTWMYGFCDSLTLAQNDQATVAARCGFCDSLTLAHSARVRPTKDTEGVDFDGAERVAVDEP